MQEPSSSPLPISSREKILARQTQRYQIFKNFKYVSFDVTKLNESKLHQEVSILWLEFIKATDTAPSKCTEHLTNFLMKFNPKFNTWNEEFDLDFLWSQESIEKAFSVPFLNSHDGGKIMNLFETCLTATKNALRSQKSIEKRYIVEIMFLMNLISRPPDNHRFLRISMIIELCLDFLKAALITYKSLFFIDISTKSGDPQYSSQMIMQIAVANAYQIIMNFISFMGFWSLKGAIIYDDQIVLQCKNELYKNNFLPVQDSMFGLLERVKSKTGKILIGSQMTFLRMILNATGVFLFSFSYGKKHLTEISLLQRLVSLFGWPKILLMIDNISANNLVPTVSSVPSLDIEFQVQLTCLRVLLEASTGFPRNVLRISDLGGWAFLIDFILWVTEVYSINPLQQEDTQAVSGRTPQLKQIFEILYFLCISSLRGKLVRALSLGPKQDIQGGKKEKAKIPAEINKNILALVVDLFNKDVRHIPAAARVRKKLISVSPELQTHVLEFVVNIIQKYPPAVSLCTRNRFWDALFSEHFYYCGYEEGLFQGLQLTQAVMNKSAKELAYYEKLHQQVLLFIKFTGTISSHNNVHECVKLINLMDHFHYDSTQLLTIFTTLDTFLQQNKETTQQSLLRIRALHVMFSVIGKQSESSKKLCLLTLEEVTLFGISKPLFLKSRMGCISLLVSFLQGNEAAKVLIIENDVWISSLLSLLFEPDLREITLRLIILLMAPFEKSENNGKLTSLYSHYFGIFHRAQEGTTDEDFNLLLMLLRGIRKLVIKFPKARNLMRGSTAFLKIISVLNTEERLDRLPELCIEVFKTLLALMAGSKKNKWHMQHEIGYDPLVDLILRVLECDAESKLLHNMVPLLFDLLVDGRFELETRYVIQNPDIIDFMFKLALALPEKQRNNMLDTFISLVSKCPINQALCCEKQLIFTLLEMVPRINQHSDLLQRFASLIEFLGTHSITVKELKRQFLLLKSQEGDFRPLGQTRLMKALQFMALSKTAGPVTFFDFNGKNSAIEGPVLEKWPRSNGYSFCFWMRAESIPELVSKEEKLSRKPRLFSFLDQEGLGIELCLVKSASNENRFCLEVSLFVVSGKSFHFVFSASPLDVRRWYFITVTHANNSYRLKDSELKLYVSGSLVDRASAKFPQFPSFLDRVCIGSNFPVYGQNRKLTHSHYFHGQLGPFILLDESVSADQAEFLYHKNNELLRSGTCCLNELENKLNLYYDSTARTGKQFLDLTPDHIRERRLDALMKGQLHSCASPDVKDTIHCLGGIQVLFPIFAQLDQPEIPRSPTHQINYTTNSDLLLQGLALLGDMLFLSPTNQQEMLRCQGFEVVGFLLEQSSPEHLISEVIVTLEDIAHKIEGFPPLEDAFWYSIICKWSVWIYSDHKIQWELLKFLHSSIEQNPSQFRRTIGVQGLLDALFFYYWYNDMAVGLQGKEQEILHPVTQRVIGRRPTNLQLHSLRAFFFSSIKIMLKQGTQENETKAIVSALIDIADSEQLVEVLDLVLTLLTQDTPYFGEQLLECGGIELFFMLIRSDHAKVVLYSLMISSRMILLKDSSNKAAEYKQMAYLLQKFDMEMYNVVYNLLVGVANFQTGIPSVSYDKYIKNIFVLPMMMILLRHADSFLVQKALQDIYILCSRSDRNCEVILQSSRCIPYFFDVLVRGESLSSLGEVEKGKGTNVSEELIYNILKALIAYTQRTEGTLQYNCIEQILLISQYYESRGLLSQELFTRGLFLRLLKSWRTEYSTTSLHGFERIKSSDSLLMDQIHFIGLVDQFLFYTPKPAIIKMNQAKRRQTSLSLVTKSRSESILASTSDSNLPGSLDTDLVEKITYSPLRGVYGASIHTSGDAQWDDLEMALLLFDTLHQLKFLPLIGTPRVKQASKQAEKGHILRTSLQMILLRICAYILRYGPISACLEVVSLIRELLGPDMKKKANSRSNYVLSHILLSLRIAKSSSQAELVGKTKVLLPLAKELLLFSLPYLPSSISQHRNSYDKQTYIEFMEENAAWDVAFDWAVQMCASFQNEERSYAAQLDKRYMKSIQPTVSIIQQTEVNRKRIANKTNEAFQYLQSDVLANEVERKATVSQQRDLCSSLIRRSWKNILRSLTNERGPWASTDEGKLYWKLDKTENFSRMRLKLKRNYSFDSHLQAVRDSSALPTEDDKEKEKKLRLFSGVKLSAAGDVELENEESLILLSDAQDPTDSNEVTNSSQEERTVYSTPCELITPLTVTAGVLEITTSQLYFCESLSPNPEATATKLPKELHIPLDQIKGIHLRRYLLRNSALEFFKTDRRNFFINFPKKERGRVYSKIVSLQPVNLTYKETGSPAQVLRKSNFTKKWQQRSMSNFDYIMQLNTIAGRSFNDITQYPVFPWVLCDYTSDTLDLDNPAVYRDLSLPIGALNATKREELKIRYEAFDDPNIPKFHHGSHYSSSGTVLFYLIRMEPFTTHFLTLQGGKFDHADRMFHSLGGCFNNLLHGSSDVKELIPEFFCLPDFLQNHNKFNLGRKQTGAFLDDILLPPWASSSEEFIRIHREALESDYVSEHLHEWVDLIFGYKQRGPAAVESLNVFYYLTYEGAVNLDDIKDEYQRKATEAQIDNFGQTPSQLLKRPHPRRSPFPCYISYFEKIKWLATSFGPTRLPPPSRALYRLVKYPTPVQQDCVAFICNLSYFFSATPIKESTRSTTPNNIVVVTDTRFASQHKFQPTPNGPVPFIMEKLDNSSQHSQLRKVGGPFAADLPIGEHLFACSKDGGMILSCGHWDSSIKCSWLTQSSPSQSLNKHKDLVTCLALARDGKTFVTGSKDTTVLVWQIVYNLKGVAVRVEETPLHILYGHNDEVTCVTLDIGLDVCVSGGKDGSCIIHNLQSGTYLRSLFHPHELPISSVAISSLGYIVFYSNQDLKLFLYNINGTFLHSCDVPERVQEIFIPNFTNFIVTSSIDGTVHVREIHTLKSVQRIKLNHKILSLSLSSDEYFLIAALDNGFLSFLSLEEITTPNKQYDN